MITININHEERDYEDLADYLRIVAESIERGNTSGIDWDTEWDTEEETESMSTCAWCEEDYSVSNSSAKSDPDSFCSEKCEDFWKEANPVMAIVWIK